MAQTKGTQDVIGKIQSVGEDLLQKAAEIPGSAKVLEAVNAMRGRVDDLQSRIRSLDPLERRVAELERRLDELASAKRPAAKKPAARKTTAKKTTTPKKPAA